MPNPSLIEREMETTTQPAPKSRKYRKHSTRLIAQLRRTFKDDRFIYRDGRYERYTTSAYISGEGWYARYSAEEAAALLKEAGVEVAPEYKTPHQPAA